MKTTKQRSVYTDKNSTSAVVQQQLSQCLNKPEFLQSGIRAGNKKPLRNFCTFASHTLLIIGGKSSLLRRVASVMIPFSLLHPFGFGRLQLQKQKLYGTSKSTKLLTYPAQLVCIEPHILFIKHGKS